MENISFGGNVIFAPENNSTGFTFLSLGLSTVGIALSSAAVALLLLTAILFKQWRLNYKNQLLLQFILARFLYVLARYVLDATLVFGFNVDRGGIYFYYDMCLLLYTELALVSWMFVFTKQMYDSLVKVLYVRGNHKVLRNSLCAWLLPVAVVALIGVTCYFKISIYIKMFLVYFFLIKWPIVFANAVLLILILRSVVKSNNNRNESNFRIIIVMLLLIFTFCIQQLVHDVYEVIFMLLTENSNKTDQVKGFFIVFNIFALYQCPISTMFWLFGNAGTRKLWRFKKGNEKMSVSIRNSQVPCIFQSSRPASQITNVATLSKEQRRVGNANNHVTFSGQIPSQNRPNRYSSHL